MQRATKAWVLTTFRNALIKDYKKTPLHQNKILKTISAVITILISMFQDVVGPDNHQKFKCKINLLEINHFYPFNQISEISCR